MLNRNSAIATFDQHSSAEQVIEELQQSGFDMKTLSIFGKAYPTEENVVGYYMTGERMRHWGRDGAFWSGIWGLLSDSAFFLLPGIGALVVAGPVVGRIVDALDGAALVRGLSAIGAALYSIGIPKKSALQYETLLKAGHFVLVVHGPADEVTRANEILYNSSASETRMHLSDATVAVGA